MGLPDYECADDLPGRLPDLLQPIGVSCTKLPRAGPWDGSVDYRMTRGWGTVKFVGHGKPPSGRYRFWLVCGSQPLFWIWDMRLLRKVEDTLVAAGAECSKIDVGESIGVPPKQS